MRRLCTPGRIVVACKICIHIYLCSATRLQLRTARRMIRSDACGLVSERISFGSGSALRSSTLTNVGSHARSSRILGTHICTDVQISCSCATCVSTRTSLKAFWPASNACARAAIARRRARTCTAHLWTRCYCVPATRRISSRKRFARWDSGTRVRYTYRAGPRVRIEILCRAQLINTPATLRASLTSGGIEATSDETSPGRKGGAARSDGSAGPS